MSILVKQSRARHWPLKGDQGEAPAWASASTINFNLNSIPLLTDGDKANYVPALCLTAYGTFTAATGDTTKRIMWEDLVPALFKSFDLQGAWHGRPLASQHVRGATARLWEHIGLGYQSGSRHMQGLRSSSAAQNFRLTLYLPLSHMLGVNGARYTSQLALLYKDAHLEINTATSAGGATGPSGVVITPGTVNMRCSAVLLPEKSIRLGPGVEWLEFQSKGAATGSDSVDLESFGNATALEGVEPGAGVDTLLALCDIDDVLGSFALNTLTQFSAPFIGQTQTKHLDPFVNMLEQVSSRGQRARDQYVETGPAAAAPAEQGRVVDMSGFPYSWNVSADTNDGLLNAQGLAMPIIVSGDEMQVTKLPTFEGTVTYYRTSSSITKTIDRTLCHQFKSWTPAKHEDFRQLVISEGLAAAVLGTRDIEPKAKRDEAGGPMDSAKARFLPVEWQAASKKAA